MKCDRCEEKNARRYSAKDDMWLCMNCYRIRYPDRFEDDGTEISTKAPMP